MKTSENINEIAKAMALAQKEIKPAAKDGVNPHFKSSFSTLSSIWEAIRQPLTENWLTVWQDVITGEKSVSVTTRILHVSGQWVEFGPLSMPLAKFDPQSIGSATSYAKRYALCAAIGVVSDEDGDDDGEISMARPSGVPVSKISSNQIAILLSMEAILPKEAKEKLKKWLKNSYGVEKFEDVTSDSYKKVHLAYDNAIKFIEQSKLEVAHV